MEVVGLMLIAICTPSNPCSPVDRLYYTLINSTLITIIDDSTTPLYLPVLQRKHTGEIYRPFGYATEVFGYNSSSCPCVQDLVDLGICIPGTRPVVYITTHPVLCSLGHVEFHDPGFPIVRRFYHPTLQKEVLYLNREKSFTLDRNISSLSSFIPLMLP